MSQDFENHFVENMKLLAQIRRTQPSTSHVYVQRIKRGIDIGWVDIPVAQAEMTLKTHPEWILLTSNKQMDDVVEKLFADEPEDTIEIPPKPSEEVGASDSHAHAAQAGAPTSLDEPMTLDRPSTSVASLADILNPPPPTEEVAPPPAAPKRAAKKTHARRGNKRS